MRPALLVALGVLVACHVPARGPCEVDANGTRQHEDEELDRVGDLRVGETKHPPLERLHARIARASSSIRAFSSSRSLSDDRGTSLRRQGSAAMTMSSIRRGSS